MARKPTNTHVLQTRVSPDFRDRLQQLADRDGRTVSDLVRHLLKDAVSRDQRRTKRA